MPSNIDDVVNNIAALLDSSGVPFQQWSEVLAEVVARRARALQPDDTTAPTQRPRYETRADEDWELSPEQFVTKYYAREKAAVTPRPVWTEDGPYGNRPAEFIGMAYAPEMMAGTLHRAMVGREQTKVIPKLLSWLRSHPMPEGVDIPTLPEWNSRQIELQEQMGRPLHPGRVRAPHARLYDANRYRIIKMLATSSAEPSEEPIGESTQRSRYEARTDEDWDLTPEQFVTKYYAREKAAVTPRPIWKEDGPYGNRPAEFIAMAYAPEMMAGTLHRAMVGREQPNKVIPKLVSWLRSHPMPEGVDIPTLPEWNSRQIKALRKAGQPIRSGRSRTVQERLYEAERYRTAKL